MKDLVDLHNWMMMITSPDDAPANPVWLERLAGNRAVRIYIFLCISNITLVLFIGVRGFWMDVVTRKRLMIVRTLGSAQ